MGGTLATAQAADVGGQGLEAQLSGALDTRIDSSSTRDFQVIAGAGLGLKRIFIGADTFELAVLPLLDIEWRRAYFFSTQRGLGLNLFRGRTARWPALYL